MLFCAPPPSPSLSPPPHSLSTSLPPPLSLQTLSPPLSLSLPPSLSLSYLSYVAALGSPYPSMILCSQSGTTQLVFIRSLPPPLSRFSPLFPHFSVSLPSPLSLSFLPLSLPPSLPTLPPSLSYLLYFAALGSPCPRMILCSQSGTTQLVFIRSLPPPLSLSLPLSLFPPLFPYFSVSLPSLSFLPSFPSLSLLPSPLSPHLSYLLYFAALGSPYPSMILCSQSGTTQLVFIRSLPLPLPPPSLSPSFPLSHLTCYILQHSGLHTLG